MAQKKAHEVDAWLAKPDDRIGIVLIYGPDRGLVSERASLFAQRSGFGDNNDPFAMMRLDAADIERQPGRLVDEANTVPMFSDKRLVWVRDAANQKALVEDVRVLAETPPRDAVVLIEAGDLKKGSGLRATIEGAAAAMALPCYADEARTVDSVIDVELQKAGMAIALEARQLLRRSLGGDRLATRGEIEKLVLYAHGNPQITADDVLASTGDVAGISMDMVIDAVLDGKVDTFEQAYSRLTASGNQIAPLLNAALRQFQSIHVLRAAMEEKGQSPASAVASSRPPVFFARRRLVENALHRWTSHDAARILERLQSTVGRTRRQPDLAQAVARHALLAITLDRGSAPR
jgi:DNA polymerase-3 subunit delta